MMVKMMAGKYMIPVDIEYIGKHINLSFAYNEILKDEVKSMKGAKWLGRDGGPKIWQVDNVPRNKFTLDYLMMKNPYQKYLKSAIELNPDIVRKYNTIAAKLRPGGKVYEHQLGMTRHLLKGGTIAAGEMGTGKSLAAIIAREHLGDTQVWYVGPKSGCIAFRREVSKWEAGFNPTYYTYEGLVTELKNWRPGLKLPRIIIFDECSKIKTPTSQRSQAALYVAEHIREEYGDEAYIWLLSGTPAPKTPTDWWHQCEVACPGYIKEGDPHKFQNRLSIVVYEQSITGGTYPKIVTWLDDERKCKVCGGVAMTGQHQVINMGDANYHPFQTSTNEVANLYKRLSGLVMVCLKKDCLDLPVKQYEIIRVKPTADMLRAAKTIKDTSARAITALTLIRELSDGFMYEKVQDGHVNCPNCAGLGYDTELVVDDVKVGGSCDLCEGKGIIPNMVRQSAILSTPKDEVLISKLEEHEEIGRYVVWAGFSGTIDRLTDIISKLGWTVLRVDKRGFWSSDPNFSADDLLDAMDYSNPRYGELLEKIPKLCFLGNAGTGGMALTLTASPGALFYSNDFNGENRMQAEDRIHRIGSRGALITDIFCMPTDQLVLTNLQNKRKLQNLTMGDLTEAEIRG